MILFFYTLQGIASTPYRYHLTLFAYQEPSRGRPGRSGETSLFYHVTMQPTRGGKHDQFEQHWLEDLYLSCVDTPTQGKTLCQVEC
jgi:hypothetical protein